MHGRIIVSSLVLIIAVYGCGKSKETAMHTVPPETATVTVSADIGKTADALFAAIPAADADSEEGDVLLSEYSGPYGGVPHFDTMNVAGLKSALESGMARALAEVEAIANNPEPPGFANTIIALERTSEDLNRVFTYWGIWRSNMSTPEFRGIQKEMAPRLSEFNSKITQNDALFQRVKSVYESDQSKTLPPHEQRLIWLTYDGFASDGATLKGEAKVRYAVIDQRLAELYTQFGNNVLADEEGYVTYITSEQLGGLPESFAAAAKTAAEEREHPGEYAITNTRSSMDPFLTFSDERDLREKVWRTYYSRGDNGDEFDNNAIIADIVKLRDERVALLGYDNYAAWRLQNRMAKTPERAIALLEAVWPAAVGRVREEVAAMQKIADAEGTDVTIEPWDYRYYMEKLRKERYALDSDEVKQYLQLNKLREAMFFVADRLFNLSFAPVAAGLVPVWHPDVAVWEVTDKTTGDHVGLWYLDPFARPGKRSGAWATGYRSYQTYNGKQTPLVSNNLNFVKGEKGRPVLVSWDDATTLFHEFGHALHSLSSKVAYPTLNSGVRDYTELQSQLLERWLMTDEVINNYLVHHETGEPMQAELVQKIKDAATFKQGFDTTEYLASALVDMRYHMIDPEGLNPDAFEKASLANLGMPGEIVMRHGGPHFNHIFSGEGYSAGYYSYIWADVLTADAAEAFKDAPGGFYDKDVARRLVENLFSVRNAVDPEDAYRIFRGRDAEIGALMRDRGFPEPSNR